MWRVMRPLVWFSLVLSLLAFVISNSVIPIATLKAKTLLFDVRKQKLAFDIKEGTFYRDMDNYIIYVDKKGDDGSHIYGVKIYDHTERLGCTKLLTADSGKMELSPNQRCIVFTLYNGYDYTDVTTESNYKVMRPFERMAFKQEQIKLSLKDFDMTRTDEDMYKSYQQMMNIQQLSHSLDSLQRRQVEKQELFSNNFVSRWSNYGNRNRIENANFAEIYQEQVAKNDSCIDTIRMLKWPLLGIYSDERRAEILEMAVGSARNAKDNVSFNRSDSKSCDENIKQHKKEWHKKFTLSIACIIFFFIGAPLGTIIRKLQQDTHAYKLKDLAYFFLDNPSSVLLKITPKTKQNADPSTFQPFNSSTFYQCKACGFASTNEGDVLEHIATAHLGEYYDSKEVECEPPKGNFNCVAKCGLSGVLLGPPNIHEFNAVVKEMIRTKYPEMSEEQYRAHIEMVRDADTIEAWRKTATKKTVFFAKGTADQETGHRPFISRLTRTEKALRARHRRITHLHLDAIRRRRVLLRVQPLFAVGLDPLQLHIPLRQGCLGPSAKRQHPAPNDKQDAATCRYYHFAIHLLLLFKCFITHSVPQTAGKHAALHYVATAPSPSRRRAGGHDQSSTTASRKCRVPRRTCPSLPSAVRVPVIW